MCVMSAVMDQYKPYIPDPYTWPNTTPPPSYPNQTTPNVDKIFQDARLAGIEAEVKELKELLESFRKAVDAAEAFDRLTGQPDCVDPEKAQLLEKVDILERKIQKLENPLLVTYHVEFDFEVDITDWEDENGKQETPEEVLVKFNELDMDYTDAVMDGLFEKNYKVTLVE